MKVKNKFHKLTDDNFFVIELPRLRPISRFVVIPKNISHKEHFDILENFSPTSHGNEYKGKYLVVAANMFSDGTKEINDMKESLMI
jgi:hypothetical protein